MIPVAHLRDPLDYFKSTRSEAIWYVDHLVSIMGEEEGDHEDLAAPLLVVVSVS